MLATNSSGVHVGCHCWAPPLLGPIAWVPLFGAIAGCHCWCAIAGCHCGVPWLDAIAGAIAACHCEKPLREKIDQSPAAFTAGWQRYCFACCTSQPILIGCITLGPGRMFALTYRVLGLGVGCWMSPLLALLCSAVFEDPRPSSLCACSPVRALVKSWCCIGGGQSPTPEPVLENCQ